MPGANNSYLHDNFRNDKAKGQIDFRPQNQMIITPMNNNNLNKSNNSIFPNQNMMADMPMTIANNNNPYNMNKLAQNTSNNINNNSKMMMMMMEDP